MIKIEHTDVFGWEAAIRGMRNPLESWDKSDSAWCKGAELEGCIGCISNVPHCPRQDDCFKGDVFCVGAADLALMKKLALAGPDHGKFLRFVTVQCDITAPLYLLKELDTYKVGTVANSCSTMHRIHSKEFTLDDFSHEHLCGKSIDALKCVIDVMNLERKNFIMAKDKDCWWQLIQLLPSSYNQKRTLSLNYAVLRNMYHARKNHKLDEWHDFCKWIEELPYSELITETKEG